MTFVVSDNPIPLCSSPCCQQAHAFRRGWMPPWVAWPTPARRPRPAGRVRESTVCRRFVDSGVNRESPNPRPARPSAAQMEGFHFPDSGRSGASGFNPGNRDARINTGLMLTKAEEMARQALDGRDEAMDAIRTHLATHGKTGLSDLRETRWGHVNPKTWYAWVATAKSPKVTPQALADARRVLASAIDDPATLGRAVGAVLPAIPSPASIAALSPGDARRSLNLFARWETLWQDCEMVRSYAVKTTDSGESIRLLKAFCQSISMRGHILRNLMEAFGQLWSIRRMQDFNDTVVDEVAKESPECAARIIARLSALSDDCGMTLDARV